MLKTLWSLFVLVVVVLALVWVADRPGDVSLQWLGFRIETSFALLAAGVGVVAVATALVYRLWLALRRAPGRVSEAFHGRRRQKGYQALTRGMVAVAAGDANEARRSVKRAEVLLNDPPLTLLLSAQAAQLEGDDSAAAGFFEAMTKQQETEFLGVRGLLTQAMKRGDEPEALSLARRAYRLRPKSGWVAGNLLELQARSGDWLDAQVTGDEQVRNGLISRDDGRRRKAVLALQQGFKRRVEGDLDAAARQFKSAVDLAPGFAPAVAAFADSLTAAGKAKRARELIEKTWRTTPHPDLLEPYWAAVGDADGDGGDLARMKATERLAKSNRDHPESHIGLARAALAARLWGEARTHLGALAGAAVDADGSASDPHHQEARVCRLWAELEDAEHGDAAAARRWLSLASLAEADSAWVCGSCGNAVHEWSALCGNCGALDGFTWRTPPHVVSLPAPLDAGSG